MQFSTQDSDNDKKSTGSCANLYKGAWWYEDCYDSSLNGEYFGGAHSEYTDYGAGVIWITWKGPQYSVKSVMMIREII